MLKCRLQATDFMAVADVVWHSKFLGSPEVEE